MRTPYDPPSRADMERQRAANRRVPGPMSGQRDIAAEMRRVADSAAQVETEQVRQWSDEVVTLRQQLAAANKRAEEAEYKHDWCANAAREFLERAETAEARVAELEEHLRLVQEDLGACMEGLEHLKQIASFGPAIHANLGEAGMNEVQLRAEYAEKVQTSTHQWQDADHALGEEG